MADRILSWPGDTTAAGDSVPLRLAGALHALKLDGLALTDVYPPAAVDDDTLWQAIEHAMFAHEARIMQWLDIPPQTNEVRRAAILLAALAQIGQLTDQPIELMELGTSAGLNLRCDKFRLNLPGGRGLGPRDAKVQFSPDWTGKIPLGNLPKVVARRGVDLNPLDPANPEDQLRLLAYIWPDQNDRMDRTRSAIAIADQVPAQISAGDAGIWLEQQLKRPEPEAVRVVFHTIAWQYFPAATKDRALKAMQSCLSPTIQIGMEADGGEGACVSMTRWPNRETHVLGRCSFHGIWVDWA